MSVRGKGDGTELIAMLTYNDRTVPDAPEIFEICKDSDVKYWGFKQLSFNVEWALIIEAEMAIASDNIEMNLKIKKYIK